MKLLVVAAGLLVFLLCPEETISAPQGFMENLMGGGSGGLPLFGNFLSSLPGSNLLGGVPFLGDAMKNIPGFGGSSSNGTKPAKSDGQAASSTSPFGNVPFVGEFMKNIPGFGGSSSGNPQPMPGASLLNNIPFLGGFMKNIPGLGGATNMDTSSTKINK